MAAQLSVGAQEMPLLRSKLYMPPLRREQVPRPRLVERLDAGLERKLTLICAPAGFGKTTLVSEWLAGRGRRVAWLSLDEGDNDPVRFLTYLVAALQEAEADIGRDVLVALRSTPSPPLTSVLTSLLNEFAVLPERIVLVLDDYHLLDSVKADDAGPASAPVHDALAFLLEHLPPPSGPAGGGLHLVLVTREDPLLPLARLRARGQLTELRGADLRFTSFEAAEFLNQAMGLDLSQQEIAALDAQIEGWIAGLQLAALALQGVSPQGRKDRAGLVRSFTGSHRFVLDYLVEEVLEQQPESVQTFLLRTSVLDRLCGPLCDAVQFGGAKLHSSSEGTATRSGEARSSGQEILEYLERANLFIIPLDDERRWYRYHHLFADLLRRRLQQRTASEKGARGGTAEYHVRASVWYEENGLAMEAFHHAAAAKDWARAASLAELAWPAMSGSFQSIAWLGRVKVLPDERVRARPVLCVGYAWAYLNSGQLEAAETRLQDAERWLQPTEKSERLDGPEDKMVVVDEEQFQSLPVSLAVARAYHAQAVGDSAATVKYARRVLDLLPEGDEQWRGDVTALLALAYWTNGDLQAAHRTFTHALAAMDPLDAIVGIFVLADLKMALGQLEEAERAYERPLQFAKEQGEPMPLGTEDMHTGISKLYRERGDLETAAQHLLTSKKLGEQVKLPDWRHRWCIAQARLDESRGDLEGALDLLDEAERVFVRTPLPQVRPIAARKARIWIKQGRLAAAQSWVRERSLSAKDSLCYLREFEHLTLARVLIARYKSERVESSIQEAVGLLERLLQAAEKGGRRGSVLEILVLQALAHEAQGSLPPALVSLERALTLAEPEGYLQLFVDEGPPMARLLSEVAKRGIRSDYAGKLLAAFPDSGAAPVDASKISARPVAGNGLLEPLSERELEVLQLIAAGLTNAEIASMLYLALNTVKGHTRNIYGKLGVHSRTKAVARAKALGILSST